MSGNISRISCEEHTRFCPERGLDALQGDPFKTLFVGRISFDATEKKLRREFEEYGPVKSIRLVHEKRSGDGLLHVFQLICMLRLTRARILLPLDGVYSKGC